MIQYADIVKDERSQSPIQGAEVYVYNVAENDDDEPSLATLFAADGSTEIENPLTTNNLGVYSFYHPASELVGDVYVGARLRYRSRLFVGGGYSGAAQSAAAAAANAVGVKPYANTGAGLAATSIGDTFWVDNGDGTGTTYRHDVGPVATQVGKFIINPTGTSTAALLGATGGNVQASLNARPTAATLGTASGAEIVAFQQAGSGSVLRPTQDKYEEHLSAADKGALPDGSDASVGLQATFDRMAVTGRADLLSGTYKVTQPLSIPPGEIRGGVVTLDFSDADPADFPGNTACVLIEAATKTALPDLASNLSIGTRTFPFVTAHGLAIGDTFQLSGTVDGAGNGYRVDYRKGEVFRVARVVDTTNVETENACRDSYTAADVECWKRPGDSFKQGCAQLIILAPDTVSYPLRLVGLDRSSIDNVRALGGNLAAIDLTDCFETVGTNVNARQIINTYEGYGLSVANCQGVRLAGNFYGRFNGVNVGGGPTAGGRIGMNRDVHIEGTFGSDPTTGLSGGNFHGNTEYSSYRGVFTNGVVLAGDKNEAHGHFIGRSGQSAIVIGEMHGHSFHISGVVRTTGTDLLTSVGAIEQQGYGEHTRYGGRTILDLECYFPNATRLMLWRCALLARSDVVLEYRRFDVMQAHASTRVIALSKLSGNDLPVVEFGKFNISDNAVAITWSLNSGTKMRGWTASKTVAVSGTTVASATAIVTFNPAFPRTPTFSATLGSAAFASASPLAVSIASLSESGGTVTVATTDKANQTISSTVVVTGTLNEQ